MSGISRDQWLSALADVAPAPEFHPDAITATEFAQMIGMRITAAKDRLRALVDAGKARRVMKQTRDISGRHMLTPAYVLIQETPDVARVQRPRRRPGR